MSTAFKASESAESLERPTWRNSELQRRADRWTMVGSLMCGAIILGPIGLPVLGYGIYLYWKASKAGEILRPKLLVIVAVYIALDAALNYVSWGVDLLPSHDTILGLTWWSGMGQTIDGAYYLNYNTTSIGGTSVISEKALQVGGVLMLFPMRFAAAWAFLKMKRWGPQMLIVTGWGYIVIWIVWIAQLAMHWDDRVETSLYGWFGYAALNVFGFLGAFITMPYLYRLDTRKWD